MTEIAQSSSTSSIQCSPTRNDGLYQQHTHLIINTPSLSPVALDPISDPLDTNTDQEEEEFVGGERKRRREKEEEETGEEETEEEETGEEETGDQLNLVGVLLTVIRRSVFGCSSSCESKGIGMEIGLPTNVRHVAHVTFDRFNGFLGLPVEFEPEVPRRPPSASTTVFGVSTNSMQLSFDTRGNSVPTILLLMQHRLYALGGLQAEGIFRINADNGQEEYVRDQLNTGLVPVDVDVHCLAGLIKAWFRELPTGVLDCLSPEQVMQSQTEEECAELARLLPPTEAALLDWAINLMADVAQFEHLNKMNARNVAMVFAPNMTHMVDPLTALMHAVQVMNFLKTLIEKTLKEREDSIIDSALDSFSGSDPSSGNGHHTPLQTILEETTERVDEHDRDSKPMNPSKEEESSIENIVPGENEQSSVRNHQEEESTEGDNGVRAMISNAKSKGAKSYRTIKGPRKSKERTVEKTKGTSLVSSVNMRTERIEAWR